MRNPEVNSRSRSGSPVQSPPEPALLDALAEEELGALRQASLYRRLRTVKGPQGPRMRVDGRDVLMMGGSNALDLAADPRVIDAAVEATRAYGCAAGGSRLINGNLDVHEALEAELAAFLGTDSTLLFSTGYMANLGVIPQLAGPGDVIVSDALNHASIIDACRLSGAEVRRYRHNDPDALDRVARGLHGFRRRILVTDGVFSMDGDVASLERLVPVARRHGMVTVVDDTHGVGVLGESARGVVELGGVAVDVQIGNLGKALGSFGAWVACSASVRDLLLNRARSFVFTCAPAPGAAAAARAALRIVQSEPWRRRALLDRAGRLRDGLREVGIDTGPSTTHIVPAMVGDNRSVMEMCEAALERGVYAQGIRYPSVPEGTARIRLSPMCRHTPEDIDFTVRVLSELHRS